MDKLLKALEDPQVQATAVVLGLGLFGYALLTLRLERTCGRARDDCDQVLRVVDRIPGL